MASVYNKINGFKYYFSNALYLNSDGTAPEPGCTADKLTQGTSIQARTYFGAPLYGITLVEKELNTLLDLTDIFTTWSTDAELAQKQFEAYQQVLNMKDGIHNVMDIHSTADRDLYQKIRQAKWDIIHAADDKAINAALNTLGLGTTEPEVMLGDIDGNGTITLADAGLLAKYCNGLVDLTETQLAAADLNGDGSVSMMDTGLLAKYCNGLITSFPAEKQ